MAEPRILPSADLDDGVTIGDGSSVWHLAQVRAGAVLGENVIVGPRRLHRQRRPRRQQLQDPELRAGVRAGLPGGRRLHRARRSPDQRHLPAPSTLTEAPRAPTIGSRWASPSGRAPQWAPAKAQWHRSPSAPKTVAVGSVVTRGRPRLRPRRRCARSSDQVGGPLRPPARADR